MALNLPVEIRLALTYNQLQSLTQTYELFMLTGKLQRSEWHNWQLHSI